MEADLEEAEGQGRPDLQAAQEEARDAAQEAAQKQETVQKPDSVQTLPAQRESEMGSRSPQITCLMLHLEDSGVSGYFGGF